MIGMGRQGYPAQLVRSMCRRKIAHNTVDQARRHLEDLLEKSKHHKGQRNLCVYQCPICGKYHVGGKRKKRRR